jgi:hypothetical protein
MERMGANPAGILTGLPILAGAEPIERGGPHQASRDMGRTKPASRTAKASGHFMLISYHNSARTSKYFLSFGYRSEKHQPGMPSVGRDVSE